MSGRKGAYVSVQTKDLRPFGSAGSSGLQQATAAISGSRDHRSADRVVEGGRTARAESPLTSKSTHRAAGGEGSARVKPSSTPRSAHCMAEGGGAACAESPSTPGSSRRTEHRVARNSEKVVSMADFKELKQQFRELKATTTEASSRLTQVEEDVRGTKGDTSKILALLMRKEKKQAMLPAPHKGKTIMPPPTDVSTESESESDEDEIEYVTSGKGYQERLYAVPIWGGKKKKSTSVGKGDSSAMSSSPSSSSERKDLTRVAGGGAMVVSSSSSTLPSPSSLSKPKKGVLPSPSSLLQSRKESTSSMSGSGLVRCSDPDAFIKDLESRGWTTLLGIVQSKGDTPEGHILTAAVNAVELSPKNEAGAVAIACLDRSRSLSAFDPKHHDCMRAAFDPENPAFKQFCIRMDDYCSRSPDKGIKFRGHVYPYAHLAQKDQHLKELIAALRDN